MKHFFAIALIVASLGCADPHLIEVNAQNVGAGNPNAEKLHLVLPEGYKVGYSNSNSNMRIFEYVPEGQSIEQWTTMTTVIVMALHTAPDIDALLQAMSETFVRGCEVRAVVSQPKRFLDVGYPAGTQSVICGKTRRFGQGEALFYKAMQGKTGFFLVQQAWRFPPAANSRDIPLTAEMTKSAHARLADVHLCPSRAPGENC
jgi:hypothetical protein